MADSDVPVARMGGRVNVDTGQLLTAADLDRTGGMAMQTVLNFLAMLFFDVQKGEPLTGFPRDTIARDHCRVTATGDLSFQVSTGWGVFYDAAATVDEFGPDVYRPIVVDTPITDTLAAHDGSNPRIDLVCLAPAWVDDQSASRLVKNPSTGTVTSTAVAQRRRFGATYQIVTGTPAASPSPPAVPAGYVAVGQAAVPASSGAAVWSDVRPPLTIGDYFKALPQYASGDYVPLGAGNELAVTASSPAAMSVEVDNGRSVTNGRMRRHVGTKLAIAAAHASFDRIDLVIARETEVLEVLTGTPSAAPAPPALPASAVALAEVLVEASVSSIAGSKITDVRVRQPFEGDAHVQARSMDHDRLIVPTANANVQAGVRSGNTYPLTISFQWPDSDDLPDLGVVPVMVEIFEVNTALTGPGGEYDLAGVLTYTRYDQELGVYNTDYILYDDDGVAGTQAFTTKMFVNIPVSSTPYAISVRRKNGTVAGSVRVVVTPLGAVGSNRHVAGNPDAVTVVFP